MTTAPGEVQAAAPASRRGAWRLWLCGGGMLAPIIGFAWRYPLAPYSNTLTDIGKLSGYAVRPFAGYVAGMAILVTLYLLALRESRRLSPQRALPAVFGCAALLAGGLIWTYPLNAIDIFLYAARSRLLTTYGANPNAVFPRDYPTDQWAGFMTAEWGSHVSPYGPLWNLIAAPITALAGDNMLAALVGLKLVMFIGLLAGGWAIARALAAQGRAQDAASCALLYMWNPLVLWEGIGNGHNDVLLTLALLLALWAWATHAARRALPAAGDRPSSILPGGLVIPLLVLATLLKYVALPLIPLAAIALWRRAAGRHDRWRLMAGSALLSIAAIALGLFPFYDLAALRGSLLEQGAVIHTSPASAAIALLHARYPAQTIKQWLWVIGGGVVLITWAYQAGALSRRAERLPRACFEALFVLLLLAVWNLRPWYLIWLVGLAALLPWGWPAWRAIAWTIGGLASYAFLIWIEAWWQPGYDRTQIVGVALMVAPTVLATLAARIHAPRRPSRARSARGHEPPRHQDTQA